LQKYTIKVGCHRVNKTQLISDIPNKTKRASGVIILKIHKKEGELRQQNGIVRKFHAIFATFSVAERWHAKVAAHELKV